MRQAAHRSLPGRCMVLRRAIAGADVWAANGPRSSHRRCLRCGYDLYAQPESGKCPECGFAFDAQSSFWRFGFVTVFFSRLVPVFAIGCAAGAAILRLNAVCGVLCCIALLVILVGMLLDAVRHRGSWLVGSSPEGLLVHSPALWRRATLLPWKDLIAKYGYASDERQVDRLLSSLGVKLEPSARLALQRAVFERLASYQVSQRNK